MPVLLQVLIAVALLAVCLGSLLASPSASVSDPRPRGVVGEQEQVTITGPEGSLVVTAQINTGAAVSAVDDDLARRLGYDLDEAATVVVESAIGDEERPVVPTTLQLAGDVFATRVGVTDLEQDAGTEVLLGREDLRRFQVVVGEQDLTAPGSPRSPTGLGSLLADSSALDPTSLLAVLPMATLVIVLLRVVVGVQTLGIFSPVLLAIGYSQAGLLPGVLLTLAMFVAGFAVQAAMRRLWLPRMVRLAVLVGMVVLALLLLQGLAGVSGAIDAWGASLPVVVTAVVVERLWETWELDGPARAGVDAAITLAVAVAVAGAMLLPQVRSLGETDPLALALGCTVAACVVGVYRGVRLLDLVTARRARNRPQPSDPTPLDPTTVRTAA